MRFTVLLFLFLLFSFKGASQNKQDDTFVSGVIVNATNTLPLENVNIINLNQVIGTTTNYKGAFKLKAAVNDTLHLTHLGFKPIKVRVTNDWIKYGSSTITLTELALALEEVTVYELKLTGYLEVDIKQVPVGNTNYQYRIPGVNRGYEAGNKKPGAAAKIVGSIFNPLDFLYNTFGRKGKELRRLKQMKQDDAIRNLLASRFDREMLMALLKINRIDLDEIVSQCNYSKEFIETANDLQVLDAISECYEEYKVLNRDKNKD